MKQRKASDVVMKIVTFRALVFYINERHHIKFTALQY